MPDSSIANAASTEPRDHIPALTGFRGFAALIVLLNHAGQFSGLGHLAVVRYGYFGVPCFFALSGALFAFLYFEKADTRPVFLQRYYAARFIRIFPVYWLVLLLCAVSFSPVNWPSLGWHTIMGHGFFAEHRHSINVPMWTLPVECSFYLLAPWMFVAMRQWRNRTQRPGESSQAVHWTQPTAIIGVSLGLFALGAGLHLITPTDVDWWKGTIFGRFFQFGLGVLTGLLLADIRAGHVRLPRFAGDALFGVAAGLLVAQIAALEILEPVPDSGGATWSIYGVKLSMALTACLLVLAAVSASMWRRLLASRPVVYLGAISYALYLLQCAALGPLSNLSQSVAERALNAGLGRVGSTVFTMLVCVGAAVVVHHLFEAPVQRWLRRRWLGRAAA